MITTLVAMITTLFIMITTLLMSLVMIMTCYLERSWNVHRGGTHHNRRTDHLCLHHSNCDLHKLDTLNEELNE